MSFREHCEVFDWGIVMEENRKVIAATGIEKNMEEKITWEIIRKMRCAVNPREKKRKYKRMAYIMAAIFVEGIYYEFNSEFMPQIIHIVEVIILTLVYIQYMAEKIEAIVINEELEKNFTHEIMVDDTCLMVKTEDMVKKIMLNESIVVFEYHNRIIMEKWEKRRWPLLIYVAEIKEIEDFLKLIERKVKCYRI